MESWSQFDTLVLTCRVEQVLRGPWVQEQVHMGEESRWSGGAGYNREPTLF